MKKTLWSTAAAALFILSLTGCAGTTEPVQTEDRPQTTVETPAESTAPVESEPIFFSAGDEQSVEDSADGAEDSAASEKPTVSPEPDAPALTAPPAPKVAAPVPQETPASAPATPAPQETPAPAKAVIKFDVTTHKGTEESPSPEPSATPEPTPEPTPTPTPTPAPPVESTPPAFNINHWIAYAQSYAKGAGLNLDPTATACWDNPIAAGAHCAYLERDIQSRLNRYAKDETITDVWIWAEPRTDGSYDFYIGYA